MSIKRLFIKLFLVSTSLTLLTVLLLIVFTHRMDRRAALFSHAIEAVRNAEEIQVQLFRFSRESILMRAQDRMRTNEERKLAETMLFAGLKEGRELSSSPEETELINELEKAVRRYARITSQMMRASVPLDKIRPEALLTLTRANELAEELAMLNVAQARELKSRVDSDSRNAKAIAYLIGILCLAGAIATWLVVRNYYYLPIRRLSKAIRALSGADWRGRFPEQGISEVREIAAAFNRLCAKLMTQRESRLRFLASVAHDLRNPLSAIQMSAQLLADKDQKQNSQAIIDVITRQVHHLDRMVGDLLDSSRIESGQLELKPEKENLVDLIQQSERLYQSLTKVHQLKFQLPERPVYCHCDALRVSQVLNNLISNAIKYSPHGGLIHLNLVCEGAMAQIRIKDQGMGIEEEEIGKIFEPFRRTGMSKLAIPGVGLGLSVSKKIVEAHGGKILVESRPGEGSTFTVCLPLAESNARAGSRPQADLSP